MPNLKQIGGGLCKNGKKIVDLMWNEPSLKRSIKKHSVVKIVHTGYTLIDDVFMTGFPSVGKSTLLSNLAGVYSEVAAYEFTTLTTVPGVIKYKGAKIQVCLQWIMHVAYKYTSFRFCHPMSNRAEKDAVRWCHVTHQVFAGGISS